MAQVSSRPVGKDTLNKIYKLLNSAITNQDVSTTLHKSCFNELLTPTEKIMLGKRLAAIALLSRGMSTYKVSKVLCMSESTTNKIALRIEKGKLKNVTKLCEVCRMGPLGRYLKTLFRPLPRYGTSPSTLFKK